MTRYKTPHALEMAAKQVAKESPMDTNKALAGFYFHRLLCRIFSTLDSPFVLKGGQGMLARTVDARYTRDIDLATCRLDLSSAIGELERLAALDLGDFVTFELRTCEPIKADDDYREGCRITFGVHLGGREKQSVSVDLVSDQVECEKPDKVTPVDRLEVGDLPVFDYSVYPVSKAIAEKYCGIIERYGGKPSSRVKDLIDLVIYALTEEFDMPAVAKSIRRECALRSLTRPDRFLLPDEWGEPQLSRYRKLALSTGIPKEYATMEAGYVLVASMLDPAFHDDVPECRWNTSLLSWEMT